jgi:hypothetical protein
MNLNVNGFNYLLERLQLVEEGYVYPEDAKITDLIFSDSAKKDLKKNPALATVINKAKRYGFEPIEKKLYGNYSIDFGRFVRGIAAKDSSGKFVVNWVGSHEAFNNIRKRK